MMTSIEMHEMENALMSKIEKAKGFRKLVYIIELQGLLSSQTQA